MFTLHLSRFLSGRPPAPILQEANVWAHREPYDSVIYCMYWFFVLGFGAPLVAMFLLPLMLLFETAQRNLTTNRQVKARQVTQDSGVPGTTQLAVVITGCDSGIGKELALCLASEGFVVFAGCLKRDSFDHFKGTGTSSIHPVILDVTCDDQVKAFQATVQEWLSDGTVKEKRHLHALVNNAGVGAAGYFDWLELSDYEYCMNINFFGLLRMIKVFLPTLKKQSISGTYQYSQIVNIISVAGMTSGGGLGASSYECSKHAAEAFTNSLRLELKMFGIRVVALNPTFFDTPLTNNVEERFRTEVMNRISPERKDEYGEDFIDNYARHCDTMINSGRWNLKVLIDSIVIVVKSKDPPSQLMVGMDRYVHATFTMFPQWVRNFLVQVGMPLQTPAILKK